MTSKPAFVISVHSGAGYHNTRSHEQYNNVCRLACLAAANAFRLHYHQSQNLESRSSSNQQPLSIQQRSIHQTVEAAVAAIKVLENDACTNAGLGSNLTLHGHVECEAAIMFERQFAGIGAVSGLTNPIEAAHSLLKLQMHSEGGRLCGGRVIPNLLVGQRAFEWATANGNNETNKMEDPSAHLKTPKTRQQHRKYSNTIRILEQQEKEKRGDSFSRTAKLQKSSLSSTTPPPTININGKNDDVFQKRGIAKLDTVGAIVVDCESGVVASAGSSGGLAMKLEGRLGQLCQFGYGCWAERGLGIVSSGTGEQLVRTGIVRCLAQRMSQPVVKEEEEEEQNEADVDKFRDVLTREFMESPMLAGEPPDRLSCGVLLAKHTRIRCEKSLVELFIGHTTPSMSVGFLSSDMQNDRKEHEDSQPQCFISRQNTQQSKNFPIINNNNTHNYSCNPPTPPLTISAHSFLINVKSHSNTDAKEPHQTTN